MRAALLSIIASTLLLLSGCGDKPIEPAPYQASKTPSASADSGGSQSAAEHAVRRFINALNRVEREGGESTEFRATFADSCAPCDRIADGFDRIAKDEGTFDSDGWTIRSIDLQSSSDSRARFKLVVTVAPQRVAMQAGAEPTTYPGEARGERLITTAKVGSRWTVVDFADPSVK